MRTSLYRVFGSAGELLYVGISKHALARFHEHSKDKEWWDLAEHVAVEHFANRIDAAAAEARAIRSERPRFNIAHAAKTIHSAVVGESRRIDWRCSECGEPVKDGDGWITVPMGAVADVEAAWAEYRRDHDGEFVVDMCAVMALPKPVKWRVLHRGCDQDPDAASYWFDVERCRTEAHLIHWTAHLMDKGWIRHTDWTRFIEERGEAA